MSKYEKKGTITFSPTAITDKEEVHDLYKRTESGCECNSAIGFTPIMASANGEFDDNVKANVTYADIVNMIEQRLPLIAFVHEYNSGNIIAFHRVSDQHNVSPHSIEFYTEGADCILRFSLAEEPYFSYIG